VEDFNNLSIERGRTNNDRRHTLSFSTHWEISYFKGSCPGAACAERLVAFSDRYLRSGTPNTITTGSTRTSMAVTTIGDLVAILTWIRTAASRRAWFTAAFTNPVVAVEPTAMPGEISLTIRLEDRGHGMFRKFKLREAITLKFGPN
jgi:hypothetical protein